MDWVTRHDAKTYAKAEAPASQWWVVKGGDRISKSPHTKTLPLRAPRGAWNSSRLPFESPSFNSTRMFRVHFLPCFLIEVLCKQLRLRMSFQVPLYYTLLPQSSTFLPARVPVCIILSFLRRQRVDSHHLKSHNRYCIPPPDPVRWLGPKSRLPTETQLWRMCASLNPHACGRL